MRLEAVLGDITEERVDAVVNAANTALADGTGVCGAIHAAAGRDELRRACVALGGCATGAAVATPGFRLSARWIIHAVGPMWHGGGRGEAELLASAYRRSLEVAEGVGARTIAFPALSTGVFGYPLEEASRIAVDTLRGATTNLELARLVAFNARTLDLYRELIAGSA